jgi:hypothetical protein
MRKRDEGVEARVARDAVKPGSIRMNIRAGLLAGYGF